VPKSRSRRQPQRRRQPGSGQRPSAAATQVPASTAPRLRGAVERRSAPVLLWLSSRPRLLLPLVSIALLAGGFLAPAPVAVPLLVLLLALVGWLTYLSWPAVQGGARVVRVATLGLLVLAVVTKVVGS
jgi:hypothetical protein